NRAGHPAGRPHDRRAAPARHRVPGLARLAEDRGRRHGRRVRRRRAAVPAQRRLTERKKEQGRSAMKLDLAAVEETAKHLYIQALKILPPDIKEGFRRLDATETDP